MPDLRTNDSQCRDRPNRRSSKYKGMIFCWHFYKQFFPIHNGTYAEKLGFAGERRTKNHSMCVGESTIFQFGERHPVLFEIVLVIAAFLAAGVFSLVGAILNVHPALSSSVGRVLIGAALIVIYNRAFTRGRPFKNLPAVIPALLFAAWNLFYNFSSGMVFGGRNFVIEALVTASAPAIFEEVLFRGILIYNLKKKGTGALPCLFISAALFAAAHLTNLVGLDVVSVSVQMAYSFVVGMVFAAVYLKNNSILQVIVTHFLIDFTNSLFVEQPASSSPPQLILFGVLLVAEAIYALWLTKQRRFQAAIFQFAVEP